MSKHRTRVRNRPAPVVEVDPIREMSEELAAIWRILPYAVERDRAGDSGGIRHQKPTTDWNSLAARDKGHLDTIKLAQLTAVMPRTTNLAVVRAISQIEREIGDIAAEALAILNADGHHGDVLGNLRRLPDWHAGLASREMPLAEQIAERLPRLLRAAQTAANLRRPDEPMGSLCPDHRDERPTELLVTGAVARLASSLLDGPPIAAVLCLDEDRRLHVHGRPTDWVITRQGRRIWVSLTGEPAYIFGSGGDVFCPCCKRRWVGAEKRILQRELAAIGDRVVRVDGAIA